MIHLKYPNPLDPHLGLSPLQANALAVDANTELLRARVQTFQNGPRPGVVLRTEQTLTDQTVSRLEDKIQAKFAGRDNWHRPLILEQGLAASPWTLTPVEMDFLNSSRMTRDEILAVFRVPAPIMGVVENMGLGADIWFGAGDVLRGRGAAEARPDRPVPDPRPRPPLRPGRGDELPRLLAAQRRPAPQGRRDGRAVSACGR